MTTASVLVLGGRSDIGRAVAHKFASLGYAVQLAARNVQGLEDDRADLMLRYGVDVVLHEFDVLDTQAPQAWSSLVEVLPDVVVCAVGLLGEQDTDQRDGLAAVRVIRTNFEGPATALALFAERFEQRGHGALVGISSVAGERGRASNYIYGSAKAGFTAYLAGLRNRLARQGVHVVTVLPGFVDTRMTAHLDLPAALTAGPADVADAIASAVEKKRDVIYVRALWRWIMAAIRCIPEVLFKRLTL